MTNSDLYPFVLAHTWGKTERKSKQGKPSVELFYTILVHILVAWNNVAGKI